MFNKISLVVLMLSLSLSVSAREIAGVKISEEIKLPGKEMVLNGAGMRTKFVFDIYVAAFYAGNPVKKFSDVNSSRPMRMAMHFVYDEVSKEKLVDGWNDGFEDNLSSEQLKRFEKEIKQFNDLFETVRKGDVINLDYVPEHGTSVTINNNAKGIVEGADFFKAILLIWLGDDPVGDDLKDALLGEVESDDD
jgi:Chalcone isomerase-like